VIPFINLRPLADELRPKIMQSLGEILDNTEFVSRGFHVQALEQQLCQQLGVRHAITCASGTSALTLALAAYNIGGDQCVAMPNVTFWATYEAVVHAGARPLLIDIDPDDLQMSFDEFKRAHKQHRFKAAIFVHLFGWTSTRLTEFRTYCREHGITLVEDGAQAYGTLIRGQSVFSEAEVITLSFHPAKVVAGLGDGGAVLTNDPVTAEGVRLLADHGRTGHYEHALVGWNSRMSGINAAYVLHATKIAEERVIADRQRIVRFYQQRLAAKRPPNDVTENGYLNIMHPYDPRHDRMRELGVTCGRVYPVAVSDQTGATEALRFGELLFSKLHCQHVLNLPVWYGMTLADAEAVAVAFEKAPQ